MITTSRISSSSSRVLLRGVLTQFVISDLADGGPSEFHIFQDAPGRPAPRCVNADPYRSLDDALQAVSCLTLV